MLDLMRQANRRKWFLWLLILPVVFSFVLAIFAIWGGAATGGRTSLGTNVWLARVNGTEINEYDVERRRQQVESLARRQYGDQFEQLAAAFNFTGIALSQLLGSELAYQEAARLGLEPTAPEVADAIVNAPEFQRAGRFIGRAQYVRELQGNGYDVGQYERSKGKDLAVDRLQELIGTMVTVGADDVNQAYADEGQTAEVDYVILKQSDFAAAEPPAKEIEAWHRDHRSSYQTPEKRRVSYALIDRDALMKTIEISDDEIRSEYEKNAARYTNPEQRRASHILFKTAPGAGEEAVRAKAEAVLARVRAGEDFATLAQQNSEDSSAASGGDLGWFGKGRMVPEFERAAWALSEGQVGDLVKTQFGFHILKLTGSRAAGVTPIEEARDQIRQQLAFDRARDLLVRKSEEVSAKLGQQSSSLEGIASELGYPVTQSAFFSKTEPIGDVGFAPQASDEIFRLKQGDVSGPINVGRGIVFARVTAIQQPEPAPFESVKDTVRADLVKSRAMEKARAAAADLLAAGAEGFKAAADKKKLELKSTGEFSRVSAPAAFNDEIKKAIFSHRANDLVGPLDSAEGVVVVKVIKRGPETQAEEDQKRSLLRAQLVQRKREEAFTALLQRLQRASSVEYNQEALNELNRRTAR